MPVFCRHFSQDLPGIFTSLSAKHQWAPCNPQLVAVVRKTWPEIFKAQHLVVRWMRQQQQQQQPTTNNNNKKKQRTRETQRNQNWNFTFTSDGYTQLSLNLRQLASARYGRTCWSLGISRTESVKLQCFERPSLGQMGLSHCPFLESFHPMDS